MGTTEIMIICGVIVLLFGAGAIPKLARSLGKAKNEFEQGMGEKTDDESAAKSADDPDSDAAKE